MNEVSEETKQVATNTIIFRYLLLGGEVPPNNRWNCSAEQHTGQITVQKNLYCCAQISLPTLAQGESKLNQIFY